MKTSKRAIGKAGVVVICAGLWMPWAANAASYASGGTITFSGAIVAPTYGIAATSASGSSGAQGFHTQNSADRAASAVDVTFLPASNPSTSAHVAVFVNANGGIAAPRTLRTRFTDNANRHAQTAGTAFSVGRAGGTLSIGGGTAAERAAIVMVSYD
ncbi:hypothetical protein J8I87_32180 [Paraburkholderia sp. LEh10]|uniref:hypothetical protein n=1 Tax=Paraburkholderia sp. LEh10 TaxID=2821353 RepID=UPI001AE880A9|nr:hypothetical protein [Paraburkholderia sp. LEh10]MBP0594246.1 hypothetical protein [Paraburkholderia sp. LEh10]